MEPGTIAFHHFGCKVNFAEASALSREFKDKGWSLTDFHEKADVYIISSCAVTSIAEKKCRAAIRQAHKLNPLSKVVVIGCFPELKPRELESMEGVDLVLGHSDKFRLFHELERITGSRPEHGEAETVYHGHDQFIPSFSFGDRTRSFLKIQDGCDYYCSYCTIPLARGKSRSDSIAHVLDSAMKIAANGVREIVLTGVNIGDFGKNNKETLLGLLHQLDKQKGVRRIRISSIEPDLLNDEIITLVAASEKFLPHFHIPLQSGSDKTLKAMHRKYGTSLYANRIGKIRSMIPNACIAADVIVGFPGETDEDFNDTYEFIKVLALSYVHVFTYSKRDNTLASKSNDQVLEVTRKERSRLLHLLSAEKKEKFYCDNAGSAKEVLWESDNEDGFMHGFTENYIRVKTPFNPELVNNITTVILNNRDTHGIFIINEFVNRHS
ncbi:MAG: tRNA (N(6)-L-threonylcarbamoyladenosine(37)-C(2))-methylthiotransferase MtaB [bacterium]